jgi:hypothetical protein
MRRNSDDTKWIAQGAGTVIRTGFVLQNVLIPAIVIVSALLNDRRTMLKKHYVDRLQLCQTLYNRGVMVSAFLSVPLSHLTIVLSYRVSE